MVVIVRVRMGVAVVVVGGEPCRDAVVVVVGEQVTGLVHARLDNSGDRRGAEQRTVGRQSGGARHHRAGPEAGRHDDAAGDAQPAQPFVRDQHVNVVTQQRDLDLDP